jgi:hypothetical protein
LIVSESLDKSLGSSLAEEPCLFYKTNHLSSDYHNPLTINNTPKMIKGTPMMAPIMVILKMIPTMINTIPKITATNLPVMEIIQAMKFHSQMNGRKIQGLFLGSIIFRSSKSVYIDLRITSHLVAA